MSPRLSLLCLCTTAVLVVSVIAGIEIKSPLVVKGPGGSQVYSSNASDYYRHLQTQSHLKNVTNNGSVVDDIERGVCYKEVPTATLVKDQNHIPAGNGSAPGLSKVRVCCNGYSRNIHNFRRCEPVCAQECVNAMCTAPDTCTCYPDHVRDLGGFCVPTCPIGCLNGKCDGGQCVCNPGYKLDKDSKYCQPICASGCEHGNCTAPNICICESGYKLDGLGRCQPSCGACQNGDCVGPSTCVCHRGYSKNAQGQCAAVCSKGCNNGICVSPEVCACSYGYDLNAAGHCEPRCTTPCMNGQCTGPDTCTCSRGYIADPTDPSGTRCIGNCPSGCPNGVCSGPGLCLCNFGYVKDRSVKGSQACIKRARRSVSELQHQLTFRIPDEDF